MKNYFIYQYEDFISSKEKFKVTVIFIHQAIIKSQNSLSEEIKTFFQEKSITDKLVVILPKYLDKDSLKFFFEEKELTFIRVPGWSSKYFKDCLMIYQFNEFGSLELIDGSKPKNEKKFINLLYRSGTTLIFKNNGGLVESTSDHHFVFPSNKHCAKFIRSGNVLVNQSQIFFIAIQLLEHVKDRNVIYCDTSSINVLPYTIFELLRRFKISFDCPIVHSFESYELFESKNQVFPPDSLVLISSSTSGNIIDRILKEKRADRNQIQVIYFLGSNNNYNKHSSNILCNLTKEDKFSLGEDEFETFDNADECDLCSINNSRPIQIRSDVFLTVQPKVEKHLLRVKPEYVPKNLSQFVNDYRANSDVKSVIKVFYKENHSHSNYEIYFDFAHLIENINNFKSFEESLNGYINKYIPANTKYLLHLPDVGSEKLANYILDNIPTYIEPKLVKLNPNFLEQIDDENGTVVIIASCITTGKKLLQISRLMRERKNLSLIYFVGIFRPNNKDFSVDLINDLKKGKSKSDERPLVAVETIYCPIRQVDTSWDNEEFFFTELLSEIEDDEEDSLFHFVSKRLDVLRENKETKGLSNNVFLKQYNSERLFLRNNFAFWNFSDYSTDNISQSEVYFTISVILNNLENRDINSPPSLKQTNYVRNLLSPRNFHRFNDGIIQSALLRCGKTEYFSYDLDNESSLKMKEFLLSIIDKYDTDDGEAILEFLLAIGLKKLKLDLKDLKEVLESATKCDNEIISGISQHIFSSIIK